jgi:hypothetical protein
VRQPGSAPPRWPLLLLLVGLPLLLLYPFLLGQSMLPADTLKSLPMSRFGHEQFFGHGRIVQWIPYLFGGMPCYASVMVTPSYLVSVLFTWGLGGALAIFKDPLAQHIFHLALLGGGAWLYLRRMGLGPWGAGFATLNLMLLTTLTGLIGAGHTIKLWTVCWMPLNLYWLERLLTERRWRLLPPAAFCLGLMLSAKHVQMSWYFLLLAGVYGLVRLVQLARRNEAATGAPPEAPVRRTGRAAGFAALWVALGLGLAAFLYLPVLDYSSLSMRASGQSGVDGGEYAAAYSYPPGDLPTWWEVSARGFGGGDYWGALEYTAFPLYMGVLWLPLLLLALWKPEDRRRLWPWLLPALLLVLLGFGKHTPLFGLWVEALPAYAKFRAHMWALAPAQLLLIFGAGLGLERLLSLAATAAPPLRLRLGLGLGAAGLAALLLALLLRSGGGAGPMPSGDSYWNEIDGLRIQQVFRQQGHSLSAVQFEEVRNRLRATRREARRQDAARGLLWLGLGLGLSAALVAGRMRREPALIGLGLVLCLDLVPVAWRTMHWEPRRDPAAFFRPQGALAWLAAQPDKHEFRIWPREVYAHNEPAWHGLHSIEGYHGAKPAGIQRVLGEGRVRETDGSARLHPVWLDLLNVRWAISPAPLSGWTERARERDGLLLENPGALPRLSFPPRWRAVAGEEQFEAAMSAGHDPAQLALLDPSPALPAELAPARGRVTLYEPDRMELEIESEGPALARLSEIWLPRGWRARLNGAEVPILRSDHLLRAVALPEAGRWRLVLEYRPAAWVLGRALSLGLALLLAAGWLAAWWRERRRAAAPQTTD